MKNSEVIKRLQTLPPDAEVCPLYDGFCRIDLHHIFLSQRGEIILVGENETLYEDEDRPEGAVTKDEDRYWKMEDKK